jgi:hypothetical protein
MIVAHPAVDDPELGTLPADISPVEVGPGHPGDRCAADR